MRVEYEFQTEMPPEGVISALTDFSENRPEIWPNLDPAKYKVHEVGDTWALVTEGSARPDIWARERYDWSVPGRVSWKAEESNFCAPGSGIVVSVDPISSGGSRVRIEWERKLTSPTGYVVAAAVRLGKDRVLGFKSTLDRLGAQRPDAASMAA